MEWKDKKNNVIMGSEEDIDYYKDKIVGKRNTIITDIRYLKQEENAEEKEKTIT